MIPRLVALLEAEVGTAVKCCVRACIKTPVSSNIIIVSLRASLHKHVLKLKALNKPLNNI